MKSIITTTALLLFFIIGFSQNAEFAKLDSYFTILEENDRFFGSVAVSHAGEIVYSKAIGYADIEANISNTSSTKFRIGSISKTFTAVLIMKAVEMDKISLDDTIEEFFPGIQNADKITVRHLLNHRSGIKNFTDRNFFSWYTKPISQTALLDTIAKKGIDFEPNTDYSYSNSNYVLLTFVLENIFDKTYAQALEQYITGPLGLENTDYGGVINPNQNEARSYQLNKEWELEPEGDMSIPLGAGGIISTPSDLCFFIRALFKGKLISNESLKQMKPEGEEEYGFALYENPIDEWNGWGHGGNIDAFSSNLSYFEESDLSFAITCNGSNYGKNDIAVAVLSELMGQPYELPSFEFVELSSEELDQYVGTYATEELPMDFIISKEGKTLSLEVSGQSPSSMVAEGNHKFSIMKYGVKMTFFPKENRMDFEQNGMAFNLILKQSSESISPTNEDLDQYLGTYESDELPMDLIIKKEGDILIGQGTGQASFPLKAEGDHVFSNDEIGLKITFMPKKRKMHFEQGGLEFAMNLGK